jgi:AAA+ ATPase superfamily predicted ATPase
MKARSYEKNRIVEFLNDLSTNVCICTGRLGMGKSVFLKNLVKEYQGVYFRAYPTTDVMELKLLCSSIFVDGEYNEADYANINVLMEKIKVKADEGDKRPFLLVIDNYPDFAKADSSFNKEFAESCKLLFTGTNVKVILAGDSMLNMHKFCLDRVTPWMKLNPTLISFEKLSFLEAVKYFNVEEESDNIFMYGITGGLPVLVDKIGDEPLSRQEAVKKLYLDKATDPNPEETMKKDLREPAYYNRMMQVLADGVQRVNEISAIVNKPKDIVVPYLKSLMKLSLVKKETPITEKNNRRKTRYSLCNTADIFWYKFIVPALPFYEMTGELPDIDEEAMEAFEREVFTEVCKEYLMEKSKAGSLPFVLDEVGNWWENNDEEHTTVGFDIVGLGKNDNEDASVFCECYYSKKQVEIQELKELIELTKKVRRMGDNFYMVFSAAGFSEHALTVASAIKNIILVDLNTVIKEAKDK